MNFNEYIDQSAVTAIYPDAGTDFDYPGLGLAGESGEVCEKLKKAIRDDGGILTEARRDALIKEMGDVAWYMAAMARTVIETYTCMVTIGRWDVEVDELVHLDGSEDIRAASCSARLMAFYGAKASVENITHGSKDMKPIGVRICDDLSDMFDQWLAICEDLSLQPSMILKTNLNKLLKRKDEGKLQGDGDDR